ncbi:2-oxoglutarate dehydrogenase E1 component [Roseateles sp. 22389]|uniref:2-oxoglutarate dehydrogenase E1 component n=1 Tax=Roseateles sp. 22389 TaxID=3453916 RepID=UPI003F842B90
MSSFRVGTDAPRPAVTALIEAFRRDGHRHALLDPLATNSRVRPPRPADFGLAPGDALTGDGGSVMGATHVEALFARLRAIYCDTLTLDASAVRSAERRDWLQRRMESDRPVLTGPEAATLLRRLANAQAWERHVARLHPQAKRFSLEGCEALLPLLEQVLETAAAQGVDQVFMGMPHRGRVNLLATLLGHPVAELLDHFATEPVHPERQRELVHQLGGDYWLHTPRGELRVALASNASHLQSVYPVVLGRTRAARSADGPGRERSIAVVLHGDAAFAGQGVVMETLALGLRPGYEVGGVLHIVINNQLGFTEPNRMDPMAGRFCTDPVRMIDAPVLRVGADDPEAVLQAARLAVDYRARFAADVVLDLVGYRRHGNSEHDVPALTSPALYRRLARRASVTALYADRLVADGRLSVAEGRALAAAGDRFDPDAAPGRPMRDRPAAMARPLGHDAAAHAVRENERTWSVAVPSLVDSEPTAALTTAAVRFALTLLTTPPPRFEPHPMLAALLVRRRALAADEHLGVDWCTAEALACATALRAGVSLRLSGLDVQRGTFMHRHAVWHNQADTAPSSWTPLAPAARRGARLEIHNSLLSEEAVLGFEYGHSVQARDTLTVWEAQFGDFVNGAQIFLDHYISCGEEKWGLPSGLTLLLPHGHEGAGPEQSNAFLGRMLQLCGADNLRVACPSTSAQYAHLLLDQAMTPRRKPLIVLTPKTRLMSDARSQTPVRMLADGRFEPVLDEVAADPAVVRRVVLCSGKLHYELRDGRDAMSVYAPERAAEIALVRVERLYPFPSDELGAVLRRYPGLETAVWAQEETRHQGAWHFVRDELSALLPAGVTLREVSRPPSAAGATASAVLHREQQADLVRQALDG